MRPFRFLLLLLLARPLFALEVPPAPTRWFTDAAGVVSTTDAAVLDTKLKSFEQETGAQFIIYIFPTIGDDAIEDFTIRAVRQWRVGQAKYDNGLVLFVFVQEKKVRVEVGYGLEGTITDAVSSRVIREQIAPHFQRGDYAGGLNAAADELMRRIRTGEKPVEPLQPAAGGAPRREGGVSIELLIFIVVFFMIFVLPMLSRRRRGGGGCGGCIPIFIPFGGGFGGGGVTFGGGGFSGGGFGGGGGGFSGGGGGFGGGGATGGW